MLARTNSQIVLGFLVVNSVSGATVTVKNGNLSYTKTGATTEFKLARTGTWTVTTSYNGLSETRSVSISAGQTQNITMLTSMYLYNQGSYAPGFTSGWTANHSGMGDMGTYVHVSTGAAKVTAISNGSVNLTGYKTISAYIEGAITPDNPSGTSTITFDITDTSGNTLLQHTERAQRSKKTYYETWSFDVNSINQAVKFRITAVSGQGSTGTINLYSVYMST